MIPDKIYQKIKKHILQLKIINYILECNNLGKKYYKRWAIKDIDLKLFKGKVTLIAGPSGSGKSTIINALSGIIPPSDGNIRILGYNINSNFEKIKPLISCVWNEISLFMSMSVVDNLRFYSFLYGHERKDTDIKIQKMLNYFGVDHESNKFVRNLSTGNQKKVDICRAFMNNFEILLLDEPSSFLDNKSKKKLVQILSRYKESGKSIMIVSHHASLYSNLIDDIIILKNGKILYNQPVDRLVKSTKEFKNAYILKTSNRLAANDVLKNLDEVKDTYVSQKSIHIYLKEDADIHPIINSLGNSEIKIKKITSKEPNLDKLIGEIINAN